MNRSHRPPRIDRFLGRFIHSAPAGEISIQITQSQYLSVYLICVPLLRDVERKEPSPIEASERFGSAASPQRRFKPELVFWPSGGCKYTPVLPAIKPL
jgi:hypothetical protein